MSAAPPPGDIDAELRRRLEERVAQGALDLPVLPAAAQQVLAATAQEDCNAKELTDLLRSDPALAGHLLRLANSPLYLPRTPIVSLQQAVSRLGMKTIRQIAIVISCETRAFSAKGHEAEVKVLFRHSLAAAVFAQEVARLRRLNVEDAFLGGLLHDIGRPVLLQAIVDLEAQLGGAASLETIRALLAGLHERVGDALVRSWKLPARMGEAILFHHHPERAPAQAQSASLLNLADDLSHLLVGPREVVEAQVRTHPMLPKLNVYPDELDQLLARRPELAKQIEAIG